VSDAPEALDLLKEFEALKESLDEEVSQRTRLEQGSLQINAHSSNKLNSNPHLTLTHSHSLSKTAN
jgi:hypothetical protein